MDLRSSKDDFRRLVDAGRAISERTGQSLRLIVVDTLNRAMAGGNENSPEDMGAFIAACDALAKELNCLVLVIHHSGKDQSRGMRGHSSLLGAVDTEIAITDGAAEVKKQRDGPEGERFGFTLQAVELGRTAKGKTLTSCIVAPAGTDAAAPKGPKLTNKQLRAREDLQEYVLQHGEPCPTGTGWPEAGARKIVPLAAFTEFLALKQAHAEAKHRSQAAGRLIDQLQNKGVAQINEGHLWLV